MSMVIYNNINFEFNKLFKKFFKKYSFIKSEKKTETKVYNKLKNVNYKCIRKSIKYKKGNRIQNNSKNEIYYNSNKSFNNFTKINFLNVTCNFIMIILFIFYNIFEECSLTLINFYSSIITIKINETGMQNILYEGNCYRDKFDFPDEIIINNETQTNISAQYNFVTTDNIIQLIWHEPRENWGCLFQDCINIIEIDFSQFNFSQRIHGNMMFYNCKSLTSLNLNDFGKVKLLDAGSIFRYMKSLISINLSNFDMSEVTDIGGMFGGCILLTSLDLSNFQTNNVNTGVSSLFAGCDNLEYINLKNAHFEPYSEFISTKKNLVFCNNDSRIISIVERYECAIIDCSDNWRQNQKKINLENGTCVDDCSLTNNNKYNYKNECYEKCPNRTYNNNFICEDYHPDCKTLQKGDNIISTNCELCADENKYLIFGNCYTIVNSTTENKVIEIIQNSFNNNFNTGSIDNGTDHVITIDSIIYRKMIISQPLI